MSALTTSLTLSVYSVIAKPAYAFVPHVRLVLAKLGTNLILNGRLHRLRHPSSTTASMHLCHSPRALCARSFLCVYLDTGTRPRHRPRLPRPRLRHPPLSASSTVQASATHFCLRRSCSDWGVSVHWFLRLRFLSSLTVSDAIVVHVTTAMTAEEC
jgi:hypothetical protein